MLLHSDVCFGIGIFQETAYSRSIADWYIKRNKKETNDDNAHNIVTVISYFWRPLAECVFFPCH